MDWEALALIVVIAFIVLLLLFVWAWPRNPNGSFMSLDEVEEILNRFPRPPSDRAKQLVIGFFATLGLIGVALTRTKRHDDFLDD